VSDDTRDQERKSPVGEASTDTSTSTLEAGGRAPPTELGAVSGPRAPVSPATVTRGPSAQPPYIPMPTPSPAPESEAPRPPAHPMLGAALIVSGVLVWTFVVMGTFTTSWLPGGDTPLPEAVALAVVVVVTLGAWITATTRMGPGHGTGGLILRFVVVGLTAFAFAGVLLAAATVVGKMSATNLDAVIATFLLVSSALAVARGRRMIASSGPQRRPSPQMLALAAWAVVGLITLGSCIELVAEH